MTDEHLIFKLSDNVPHLETCLRFSCTLATCCTGVSNRILLKKYEKDRSIATQPPHHPVKTKQLFLTLTVFFHLIE